jgi:SAM-dependent methyltransferase
MLEIAKEHLATEGYDAARLVQGTLSSLPYSNGCADLAIAGWVFGHQRSFEPQRWRAKVDEGIRELLRVTRPGGSLVLFETMGTATDGPGVRGDLGQLYTHLEEEWGFDRKVVTTDYLFETPDDAAERMRFFFGDAVANRIVERGWARVPEWTACFSMKRAAD